MQEKLCMRYEKGVKRPQEFELFSKFPLEIQAMILELERTRQERIVAISTKKISKRRQPDSYHFIYNVKVHDVCRLSKATRSLMLPKYPICIRNDQSDGSVLRIDPKIDHIIFLHSLLFRSKVAKNIAIANQFKNLTEIGVVLSSTGFSPARSALISDAFPKLNTLNLIFTAGIKDTDDFMRGMKEFTERGTWDADSLFVQQARQITIPGATSRILELYAMARNIGSADDGKEGSVSADGNQSTNTDPATKYKSGYFSPRMIFTNSELACRIELRQPSATKGML